MSKEPKVIIEEEAFIKTVITLKVKADRLIIKDKVYEREAKNEDWWESMGSTRSIPLKELKEVLESQ